MVTTFYESELDSSDYESLDSIDEEYSYANNTSSYYITGYDYAWGTAGYATGYYWGTTTTGYVWGTTGYATTGCAWGSGYGNSTPPRLFLFFKTLLNAAICSKLSFSKTLLYLVFYTPNDILPPSINFFHIPSSYDKAYS